MPAPSVTTETPEKKPRAALVARDERELYAGLTTLLPELRGRARRLTRCPDLADDLAQDTVERAIRFSAQYERGTNLRAWVHQILFSVFITRYRRSKRERNAVRHLAGDPCAWTRPEGEPSPECGVSLGRRARAELEALPDTFRQVIQLVDLGDLTYREASEELAVPMGTVMSRLHRGRKLLAAQLREAA